MFEYIQFSQTNSQENLLTFIWENLGETRVLYYILFKQKVYTIEFVVVSSIYRKMVCSIIFEMLILNSYQVFDPSTIAYEKENTGQTTFMLNLHQNQ